MDSGLGRVSLATEHSSGNGTGLKAPSGPVEHLLDDALTAVRLEQFESATRLLNQYLASPLARQADAAKLLLREISAGHFGSRRRLWRENLGDAPLKDYLRHGVDLLVAAIRDAGAPADLREDAASSLSSGEQPAPDDPQRLIAHNPRVCGTDRRGEQGAPEPAAAVPKAPETQG